MGKIDNGVYYGSNGEPRHKGVVEYEGKYYYAGKDGVIAKDERKTIHHGMANGLVSHGSYYFDKDGVCDLNSYKEREDKDKEKDKKSKKSKSKKNVKQIVSVVIICIIVAIFAGIVIYQDFIVGVAEETGTSVQKSSTIKITAPTFDGEVYLCSAIMQKYYEGEYTLVDVVASGATAYQPLVFKYTVKNAETATLCLSENEDYTDSEKYELSVKANSISIDNLKVDTTYYYIISAEDSYGNKETSTGSFKTANTNRFLSFDGIYNTRDIGGYDTVYGKKVKQGVLIRGTELDGLVQSSYFLKDVKATEKFGFKCDFDLRSDAIFNTDYVSRLGSQVTHKFYNSPQYGGIFYVGNEALLKEIFTDLADENNYPMYLHCTYGADRTGTIVFLLQGLLGVSEEDMRTEYALTGFFSKSYASGSGINSIFAGVEGCKGDTINEKIESYMIDTVGITKAQIQSIRDIFLK